MAPGLYLHVPFCLKKCLYCDFVSFERTCAPEGYFEQLAAHMALSEKEWGRMRFSTIYFGGGTPTLLSGEQVAAIMAAIREHFSLEPNAEVTLEANPGTITARSLAAYRAAGINRLSLGVQSLEDKLLRAIGRVHTRAQALEAITLARQAGFDNVSVDVMYGLPGQTTADYLNTLEQLFLLSPEHISAYSLILEEGTPLARMVARGEVRLPDPDAVADMCDAAQPLLAQAGYSRYEISNYAKPGKECRHNLTYWANGEYLGLGPAAHSALRWEGIWTRFANHSDPDAYTQDLNRGVLPLASLEAVPPPEEMFECVMLGLRTLKGVDREAFFRRFGRQLQAVYPGPVAELRALGLLAEDDARLRLNARGLDLHNRAAGLFLPR